jgi:hypothetical protein
VAQVLLLPLDDASIKPLPPKTCTVRLCTLTLAWSQIAIAAASSPARRSVCTAVVSRPSAPTPTTWSPSPSGQSRTDGLGVGMMRPVRTAAKTTAAEMAVRTVRGAGTQGQYQPATYSPADAIAASGSTIWPWWRMSPCGSPHRAHTPGLRGPGTWSWKCRRALPRGSPQRGWAQQPVSAEGMNWCGCGRRLVRTRPGRFVLRNIIRAPPGSIVTQHALLCTN